MAMSGKLCILVPVWHSYRWMAPLTIELLDKYWPSHPPVYFAGLTAEEAGALPHVPVSDPSRRSNWSWMTGDAVSQIAKLGFERVYLIAEEHLPLGPCEETHLNETLPCWMGELDAAYISLMGWDNRRYTSRSPRLSRKFGCMMHLCGVGDPRFHLHPALWRLDVLQRCCELAQRDKSQRGSAWHFEKVNDKLEVPLDEKWKKGCYQISALRLAPGGRGMVAGVSAAVERFVFNKLMALYPRIPSRKAANAFALRVGFDNFFCDGPYPMFYSGLMAKGGINRYAAAFLRKTPEGRKLISRVVALHESSQQGS